MYVLTYGTGWGPFKCEFGDNCTKDANSVVLTDEEHLALPESGGDAIAVYIESAHVGRHICKTHLKTLDK